MYIYIGGNRHYRGNIATVVLVDVSDAAFLVTFYKIALTASAVSWTNLGSILIFASCVVGILVLFFYM